jgi:uncharacterized protein YceK
MSKFLITFAVLGLILGGCASYAPIGVAYTGGTTGLSANNDVKPTLRGEACVRSIIALFTYGDGSIAEAKRNGGITKVATVDYDVMNVLGVYGQYCTVVRGE